MFASDIFGKMGVEVTSIFYFIFSCLSVRHRYARPGATSQDWHAEGKDPDYVRHGRKFISAVLKVIVIRRCGMSREESGGGHSHAPYPFLK